eukprot:TRINITY_DN6126_c0_g1_i1.p1 TRINITY_DN6126_c0_g1~~TRINITY_DN6126_c0_g1_i1.p1  ORF type:complete len:330 (+),score=67.39 TRINITY_DN6126_c0_g1_i1:64-1053(+)
MRPALRCLVTVAGVGTLVQGRSVTAGPHENAAAYANAGEAALAAASAAESAATAHQIAVNSENAVTEAVAALHLTEQALRDARATSEADDIGKLIKSLDKEETRVGKAGKKADGDKHRAKLEKFDKRLRKLEARYDTVEVKQRAMSDAEYARRLDAIRKSIQYAEYQLDVACGRQSPLYAGTGKLEIDTAVAPYPGAIESFGTEGTAGTLTVDSVAQSDAMVDSIERAQNMESKRSVYRALTHLRGATITAYDGIAHAHMKNVEQYAKTHKWRMQHPVHHLAEEESDTARWAFPVHRPSDVVVPPMPVASPAPAAMAPQAPAPASPAEG